VQIHAPDRSTVHAELGLRQRETVRRRDDRAVGRHELRSRDDVNDQRSSERAPADRRQPDPNRLDGGPGELQLTDGDECEMALGTRVMPVRAEPGVPGDSGLPGLERFELRRESSVPADLGRSRRPSGWGARSREQQSDDPRPSGTVANSDV